MPEVISGKIFSPQEVARFFRREKGHDSVEPERAKGSDLPLVPGDSRQALSGYALLDQCEGGAATCSPVKSLLRW